MMIPTTIEQLEEWMRSPKEHEHLEFKTVRSSFHSDKLMDYWMCEEQGLGLDRVIKSTEVYQLPAPDFRLGKRHFTVVLFAHKKFQEMDRNERLNACFWHCVLRYVTNQKMNNQSLRERFNLPQTKVE